MNVSTFFGALGLAMITYGVWRWWLVSKMRKWTKTPGRIARFEEEKRMHAQHGITAPYFVPKIEVAYEVSGTKFRTTRFSVHNFTVGFPGEARELFAGRAVGDTVEVHYDPSQPGHSIVQVPSHDGALVATFLGLILITLNALVAYS